MRHLAIRFFTAVLLLGLFVPVVPGAFAQSSTNGAIGGDIHDASGGVVVGAAVTAVNDDTGAAVTGTTSGAGVYRLPEVAPGTYTVTITAPGYNTFKSTHVVVTVGGVSELSPKLEVGKVSNVVEVTDLAPEMHTDSNEISTTIDQATIDNLPINGRRWSTFALLTPGVVSNSDGFGLLSFRGISYLLNNSTVDGADNNQAYFSEERGRTRASYFITQAAVQEFQVNTSNYSAEYGRSAGGVVNTVTKSGTNKLHGELFFYDRDNSLGGSTNPYTTLTTQNSAGAFITSPYKPTDWRKQWGFGVGSPLIHDKLFWFYAYDQSRRNFPGTARASDAPDTFAAANYILPANETCSTTQFTSGGTSYSVSATSTPSSSAYPTGASYQGDYSACLLAAVLQTNYSGGAAYYAQGLGIINSFLGQVPRRADQVINMPKLDWQINERNHFTIQYNRLRFSSPAGVQTQTSNFYGTNSFGNDFVKADFGVARLTTVINNSLINSFLAQYGRDFEYESSQPPSPNEVPLSNNSFGRPPEVNIAYNFNSDGFDIGKSSILERKALPDEHRIQGMDTVSYSHGAHTTKAGLDYNQVNDYINNLYNENGNYEFDYSYDFIADYLHAVAGVAPNNYTPIYYSFSQGFGNPAGEITTREYAGFLTDDWRIRPNLTLTLGVRYEYEYVPANITPNPAIPQSYNRPDDRNNVGPRAGFAWNVYGDGKTTLRGGYGLYYGRIINSNILQTDLASGGPNAQLNYTNIYAGSSIPSQCVPVFPALLTAAIINSCKGSFVPNVWFLNSHLQNPEVHEADLAIEQDLGHNLIFSVTYMSSFGRELDSAVDTNVTRSGTQPISYTVNNTLASSANSSGYVTLPHGGKPAPLPQSFVYTTPYFLGSQRINPNYGEIIALSSNVNSSYNALAVQMNRRFNNGFSLLSNYTWAHALDFNPYIGTGTPSYNVFDPTNLGKEYGNSSLDVRSRFVGALVYQPSTHFHGYQDILLGGWRIAPIVQVQTGLPYTPTVSGSPSAAGIPGGGSVGFKGINGTGSSADRIDILGRNNYNNPKTAVVDLRLGKNFYIPTRFESFRLELFAEAFNVMNHQNITSVNNGAYSITTSTANNVTTNYLNAVSTFGTYNNSNSNTIYSPRQLQLAARLHF